MAGARKTTVPVGRLRLYQQLLASVPEVAERSNFGAAYTAINGNMYSIISKHGVVGIRLPDAERAAFIQKYRAESFRGDPAWPPAKEYVAVPDNLLEHTDELSPYLEISLRYALSLKPKPTKRASRA